MHTDPLKNFGLRLVEIRKQKNFSQEKLALESGIARSYLSGVERGKRNIALINICKLANVLGVPMYVLLQNPSNIQENNNVNNV
ncbi:helix-turn-helix transcriptional regulator [Moraxella sp. VT-16-12]|nr:helix-turn-helix transcriptional regulator [Moraxella sp. VT-16-12]